MLLKKSSNDENFRSWMRDEIKLRPADRDLLVDWLKRSREAYEKRTDISTHNIIDWDDSECTEDVELLRYGLQTAMRSALVRSHLRVSKHDIESFVLQAQ